MVFGTELRRDDNLAVASAPVKFPSIWDAPYFSWAQYNGSVEQSMVRNVGEALGVRARVAFNPGGKTWGRSGEQEAVLATTVDMPGLSRSRRSCAAPATTTSTACDRPCGRRRISAASTGPAPNAARSSIRAHCQGCHLPPLTDLVEVVDRPSAPGGKGLGPRGVPVRDADLDGHRASGSRDQPHVLDCEQPSGHAWVVQDDAAFDQTEFFLDLDTVDLGSIRTDPGQARNFARSVLDSGDVLLPSFPQYDGPSAYPMRMFPFGVGLQMVTIAITTQFYDRVDAQTPAERAEFIRALPRILLLRDAQGKVQVDASGTPMPRPELFKDDKINRDEWNGYRVPAADAKLGYRPRPLNGIWATPPYLHNGAVPTLYDLLSPREERPTVFYTGSREYDLDRIGHTTRRFRGGFRYDTRVEGNSNDGHLFQAGGPGNGVIGPLLTPDDRRAIIEYLKTLCPPGTRTDPGAPGGPALCQTLPGLAGTR